MSSHTSPSPHYPTHLSDNGISETPRQIHERFTLKQYLAHSALADIYQATDHQHPPDSTENKEKTVWLLLVHKELAQLKDFESAWDTILARPAPHSSAYPRIIAYGNDQGDYWLAISHPQGHLLQDVLVAAKGKPLSTETAIAHVEALLHSMSTVQAGSYGFLEPQAVLQDGQQYTLLNAPLVKVLQQHKRNSEAGSAQMALRSAYISPSVAVGDASVIKDDTFSVACILYHLLKGQPAYAQDTLAASANGNRPIQPSVLKRAPWGHLSESLSLQRTLRAETPEQLLQQLGATQKSKAPLALAALSALGIVAYAGTHLYEKAEAFLPSISTPQITQQDNQSSHNTPTLSQTTPSENTRTETPSALSKATANLAGTPTTDDRKNNTKVDESDIKNLGVGGSTAISERTASPNNMGLLAADSQRDTAAKTTIDTAEKTSDSDALTLAKIEPATQNTISDNQDDTEQQSAKITEQAQTAQLQQLLQNAQQALSQNRIDSKDTANLGVLPLLRQIKQQNAQVPEIQTLLAQVIRRKQNSADKLIRANKIDEAQQRLTDIDDLMREFIHTDSRSLQQQIALETRLENRQEAQRETARLLQQAKTAISKGRLSRLDARKNHAMSYINRLVKWQPNSREARALVTQIAEKRQKDFGNALRKGRMRQAANYLQESNRLVKRFNLKKLKSRQRKMARAYQAEQERIAIRRNPPAPQPPTVVNRSTIPPGTLEVETADGQIIYLGPEDQPAPQQQAIINPPLEPRIIHGQPPINPPPMPAQYAPAPVQRPVPIQRPVPVQRPQQPAPIQRPAPVQRPQPVQRPIQAQQAIQQVRPRPVNPPVIQPPSTPVQTIGGQMIYMEPVPFNQVPRTASNIPIPEIAPLNLPEVQPLPEPIPELIEISPEFINQGLQGQ